MGGMPQVFMTQVLRRRIEDAGADADQLMSDFAEWKQSWPAHENDSNLFGKNSCYRCLPVGSFGDCLWHVHLRPQLDIERQQSWDKQHALQRGRKTSDRCLIYVQKSDIGPFLLIYLLNEPNAHKIAERKTPAHKQLMEQCADVGDQFLTFDRIDA